LPGLPHLGNDVKPADSGQHHVENDDIEGLRFGFQFFERRFARIHQLHLIAFSFQVKAEAFGEVLLVLDY